MKVTDKLLQIIKDGTSDWTLPGNFVYSFDRPIVVDPVRFLAAISMNESTGGIHRVPRYESGYGPGGIYYNKENYAKWGAWACCSYSSFQIMYPTAVELGFTGNPVELQLKDEIAIVWVKKYFDRRVFAKTQKFITMGNAADAYNSGSFLDNNIPQKYIANFYIFYNELEIA